ncbi:MAG: hypothetical protein V3V08_14705 [Nannocystaceae bacterium]
MQLDELLASLDESPEALLRWAQQRARVLVPDDALEGQLKAILSGSGRRLRGDPLRPPRRGQRGAAVAVVAPKPVLTEILGRVPSARVGAFDGVSPHVFAGDGDEVATAVTEALQQLSEQLIPADPPSPPPGHGAAGKADPLPMTPGRPVPMAADDSQGTIALEDAELLELDPEDIEEILDED